MKKERKKGLWVKKLAAVVGTLALLLLTAFSAFMYKVKNGFPFFEEDIPTIQLPENQPKILLFSKANAFVHSEAIAAGKVAFKKMATDNNWFLYEFDEGGVFNEPQLSQFDLVIWNNVSGKVLTNKQRIAFQHYIENGGSFLGIHAAGDDSHHWDWYTQNLIAAKFSHHPIKEHLQTTSIDLQQTDQPAFQDLPKKITLNEEWYVFFKNPKESGAHILYQMDGNSINPNGNMLWITDKNFGMGVEHPNIWYKKVGKGKAIYSALGHDAHTYMNKDYLTVLEKAINWGINK